MIMLTKREAAQLERLNATYRITARAPTYKPPSVHGAPPVQDTEGFYLCEMLDLTVAGSPPYCSGTGATERAAFEEAIGRAESAPKPLTPAQAATLEAARRTEQEDTENPRRENAALREYRQDAKESDRHSGGAAAPKRGPGRPRKNPPMTDRPATA